MIDGLKPYPQMKDSGVPWFGEVPEHWPVRRLKYLLRERDVRSSTGAEQLLRVSQFTGVTERRRPDGGDEPDTRAESLVGYKLVEPDDLVINIMLAWNGSMGVSRFSGIASPAYCVYRFSASAQPWYFHDLLRSPAYKGRIKAVSTGVVESRLRLYTDDLFRLDALVPPLPEQAAIVRFLDHADRRIRRYIRAKQKLIKLLEEQKQAIIHHAVTRGLDLNVRLKPSGVKWLGDVPEHWEVAPFKRRVGFQEGPGIMAADFRDEGVPLLRLSCLQGQIATLAGCNFLDPEMVRRRWSHFAVRPGDYLLSASASTGNVVLATDHVSGAIPYTGILRLWPISDRAFMPYVRLYMRCRPFQDQIDAAKSGVAIEHFGPTHLKRMQIALPPVAEQRAIVDFIESEVAPFASATARAADEIALLREYRTRLSADVVTGKLDVREAAARLPQGAEDLEPLDEAEVEGDAEESDAGDGDGVPEEVEA